MNDGKRPPWDVPTPAEGLPSTSSPKGTKIGPRITANLSKPIGQNTLIVLTGADAGRSFRVEDELLLGRAPPCSGLLQSSDISRQHARITRVGDGFVIEDLESRNGTSVNGYAIGKKQLKLGDRVRFGEHTILLFTYRDDLEDRLMHLQKMEALGRLSGGIAHDFNNLIGAIVANTSVLRTFDPNTPIGDLELRECLGDINSAAHRASELTRQLVNFSRVGASPAQSIDLSTLISDVMGILRRTLRNIELSMELTPQLYTFGDPTQLHQALMNLSINARDAMPEGGRLTIAAKRLSQAELLLSVEDTGVGIPPEIKNQLFEPFFTTKSSAQGSGLGLATTQRIISAIGGTITVHSELGQGARFEIRLPSILPPPAVQSATAVSHQAQSQGRRGVVLVIDDDALYLRSCKRLLESAGFEVLLAKDGRAGLELFERVQERLDLVLLDMVMPQMSGHQVLQEIRRIAPHTCVIAMSADDAPKSKIIEEGANAFLSKPYDLGALEATVEHAMSH